MQKFKLQINSNKNDADLVDLHHLNDSEPKKIFLSANYWMNLDNLLKQLRSLCSYTG